MCEQAVYLAVCNRYRTDLRTCEVREICARLILDCSQQGCRHPRLFHQLRQSAGALSVQQAFPEVEARSQMARAQAEPRTAGATPLQYWAASMAKNGETKAKGRPASLPSRCRHRYRAAENLLTTTQKHQTAARAATTRERAHASAIAARAVCRSPMPHRRTRKASMPEVTERIVRKCDVATRNGMLDLDDLTNRHTYLDTTMQRTTVRRAAARSAASQHIRTRKATECKQSSACNAGLYSGRLLRRAV